jgi:hypothetical protein
MSIMQNHIAQFTVRALAVASLVTVPIYLVVRSAIALGSV